MSDPFATYQSGLSSPAKHLFDVVPDDGADLSVACRALNVSGSGTVRVTSVGGEIVSVSVAAGIAFPVRCSRVWATGTTATGIVAMY
jgi:hypothetical protein